VTLPQIDPDDYSLCGLNLLTIKQSACPQRDRELPEHEPSEDHGGDAIDGLSGEQARVCKHVQMRNFLH